MKPKFTYGQFIVKKMRPIKNITMIPSFGMMMLITLKQKNNYGSNQKLRDSLGERKKYVNYTLNFLETKLTKSDSDIDILISRLKHMKLMNKNMTVQQLKSNMDSIFTFKQDIKCIEKSLNKIYELYTQFLEEEIIKKK